MKAYLEECGLSRKGNKAELAALAYSCNIMKKPITESLTDHVQLAFNDYQNALNIQNLAFPEPLKITTGWVGEEEGIQFWPPLTIVEIMDYLRGKEVDSEEMLSEYKAGKAYDYFKNDWLKEISYNSMNQFSICSPGVDQFCVLKADCTPSQRLHDPNHNVWVLLEKETGSVQSAYCSCAAGYVAKIIFKIHIYISYKLFEVYELYKSFKNFSLSQNCNHVAGVLFRVEAAVRAGLRDPT